MTDYKKLRELAEKATPGPWTQVDTPWGDGTWVCTGTGDPHGQMPVADCEMHCHEDEYESEPRVHENAAFIAALSPSTVIQLLNEVERLREDVRQARAITQAERLDHISTLGQAAELERQLSSTRQRLAAVEQGAEQVITAENITDEMIAAIRDAACECRPRRPIESDNHCASHDCDVSTYDVCVTALEAVNEEADTARVQCAAEANDILQNHGPASAYWRALTPLISKRAGKGGAVSADGRPLTDMERALNADRDSLRLRIAELEKERDEERTRADFNWKSFLRARDERDEARAIISRFLPHPNGPDDTSPGDPDAWNAAMFNLGEQRERAEKAEQERDRLATELATLEKYIENNNDEYRTMKEVLRAEHQECQRMRPVVEAAKAWREAEIVEQGLRATTGWTTESRSLIGRTHAALIAAIDSLSTKGPTNE